MTPALHILESNLNDLYGYVINHPNPEAIAGASRLTLSDNLALPPIYRVDQQIVTLDNEQERLEGAALYIEHQIRALFNRPLIDLTEELTPSFDDYVEFDMREYFGFGRFYGTGSAVCRILDLQGIAWKNDVINGETPYDVAINHYDIRDRNALLEAAKAAYNYPELWTQATRYAEAAPTEPWSLPY
ncbi:MAG: hypothetical protein MJA27_25420 [Pseudanabaenales cyanobacterium]|nr:hypothetical protein [Pseudanabaenales cyanobacterium]